MSNYEIILMLTFAFGFPCVEISIVKEILLFFGVNK